MFGTHTRRQDSQEPRSPTCVNAARRFFLGGSCSVSLCDSVDGPGLVCGVTSDGRVKNGIFSSMLAAGVSGGSAVRFIGTTGVTRGDTVGRATEDVDGVDRGVAIDEFVMGRE